MATIAQKKAVLDDYARWVAAREQAGQDLSVAGHMEYLSARMNSELVDWLRQRVEDIDPAEAGPGELVSLVSELKRKLWDIEPVNPPAAPPLPPQSPVIIDATDILELRRALTRD